MLPLPSPLSEADRLQVEQKVHRWRRQEFASRVPDAGPNGAWPDELYRRRFSARLGDTEMAFLPEPPRQRLMMPTLYPDGGA